MQKNAVCFYDYMYVVSAKFNLVTANMSGVTYYDYYYVLLLTMLTFDSFLITCICYFSTIAST